MHIIHQQEAIFGLPGDGGNFMRMQPKIQSMQNAAGARNSEEGFQVADMIPHQGGNPVARLQTELSQRRSEPPRTPIKFPIAGSRNRFVRFAGDNLNSRKYLPGTLQNGGQRQRKIHHRAAHVTSRAGTKWPNRITNAAQSEKLARSARINALRRCGTISVAKAVNFREDATDR
jgi:hypothetical protein